MPTDDTTSRQKADVKLVAAEVGWTRESWDRTASLLAPIFETWKKQHRTPEELAEIEWENNGRPT